jgi:hypothetical protein
MHTRSVVAGALLAWGLLAAGGCKGEDGPSAAAAPGRPTTMRPDSGGSEAPPPPPPAVGDAGGSEGPMLDGGVFALDSGQLRTECEDITAVPFIGEDSADGQYANAIAMPADLLATRIVGTWSGSCEPAAIKIEMSDGDCPDGEGHALTFLLDALSIRDGLLGTGIHDLAPDSTGGPIRIRYVRPTPLESAGTYGTCDGVLGNLNVAGELGTVRFDRLQARFEMQLAPCDGSGLPLQSVLGTFNVELQRSLSTVCPP